MGKIYRIGSLVIILVLPIIVYIFLKFFTTQHFDTLKIVGEKTPLTQADGSVDTLYHNIFDAYPDFRFKTQRGDYLTWDSLRGHIFIADVFFTRCPGICPRLSRAMAKLQDYYDYDKDIRFLSISVDPEHDSVEVLKAYADEHLANPNKWYFITGEKEKIYELAHNAFFFKALEDENGELGFVHDQNLMLIDPDGRVRIGDSFYDGTKSDNVELLIKEIKVLKIEYAQKQGEK